MDLAAEDLKRRVTKTFIALIAGSLILSAAILALVFNSGISLFAISGSSMNPTLDDQDTIILQQESSLQNDQIVILKKPETWNHSSEKETLLVKRIVAVPGDTLKFDGRSFMVNGVSVYDLDTIDYECKLGPTGYEHTLTDKEIFVMGDNPRVSLDSRRVFCSGEAKSSLVSSENLIHYGKIIMKF